MSKKADKKSGKKKEEKEPDKPLDLGPEPWIKDLAKMNVNDDQWSCYVTLMVETEPYGGLFLGAIHEAFQSGKRWPVQNVSRLELLRTVKIHSKSKKLEPRTVLCQEIRRRVGPYWESDLPAPLLASLIKYHILAIKTADVGWRNDAKKSRERMQERYNGYREPPKPEPPPSKPQSKSTKSTPKPATPQKQKGTAKSSKNTEEPPPVVEVRKFNTRLSRRGEPCKSTRWIQDYPEQGPNIYFLVSSFYDPDLPLELMKLGVPLTCILQLESRCKAAHWQNIAALAKINKYRIRMNRRRPITYRQEFKPRKRQIGRFWMTTAIKRSRPDTCKDYKDVILAKYVPPVELIDPSQPVDSGILFRSHLYDELSYLMYDIYQIRCWHQRYMERAPLEPLEQTFLVPQSQRYYEDLMDRLPCEAATVPIILDTLVALTCISLCEDPGYRPEDYGLGVDRPESARDEKGEDIRTRLEELHKIHDLFVDEVPYKIPEWEKVSTVLLESDTADRLVFYASQEVRRLYRERVHHILTLFWRGLCRSMYFKPRCLAESVQCREKYSPGKATHFWLCSAIFNRLEWKGRAGTPTSELLKFTEEMTPPVALQSLYEAFWNSDCLTIARFEPFGVNFLKFHESYDGSTDWCAKLPTRMQLRDFVDYTMIEESGWVSEQKAELTRAEKSRHFSYETIVANLRHPVAFPIPITDNCSIYYKDFVSSRSPRYETLRKTVAEIIARRNQQIKKREDKSRKKWAKRRCYDLGDDVRVQFDGLETYYRCGPGCRIRLAILQRLYRYADVNVACHIGEHCLRYDSPMERNDDPAVVTVSHRSGIIIAITQSEPSLYFDFRASWPSGLLVRAVRIPRGPAYLKQRYCTALPHGSGLSTELYRCVLGDGTVLVFRQERIVDVLLPNGTIMEYWEFGGDYEEGHFEGESDGQQARYNVITPDGNIISVIGRNRIKTGEYYVQDCIDVSTDSVRTERADGTVMVHRGDGSLGVYYPDGTIVTTKAAFTREEVYCEWEPGELEKLDRSVASRLIQEEHEGEKSLETESSFVVAEKEPSRTTVTSKPNEPKPVPMTNVEIRNIEYAMKFSMADSREDTETDTEETSEEQVCLREREPKPKRWELEGYVGVETSVIVGHPFYATVECGTDRQVVRVEMPFGVALDLGERGELSQLNLDLSTSLSFDGGNAFFRRRGAGGVINQEFRLNLLAYRRTDPSTLERNRVLVRSVNRTGGVLEVNTYGDVNIAGRKWTGCPDEAESRYFVIGRNYSGSEFMTKKRAYDYFRYKERAAGCVLQKYDSGIISDYVSMSPMEEPGVKWTMENGGKGYGQSGLPRVNRETRTGALPSVLVLRHFREFVEVPEGVRAKRRGDIVGDMFRSLDLHLIEDFYRRGSLYTKSPDGDFARYLEKSVLRHSLKLACREQEKARRRAELEFQKKSLAEGRVPPYFETSAGVGALLKIRLFAQLQEYLEDAENTREVERILETPLDRISDETVERLVSIVRRKPDKYCKSRACSDKIRQFFNAGRQLSEYFPNMKSVLIFHFKHACIQ